MTQDDIDFTDKEDDDGITRYSQKRLRKAEFITPPNKLKKKVGSGGIADEILNKAQVLLENTEHDFLPLAERYLNLIMQGIETARKNKDHKDNEAVIAGIIYPAMQLKANGGMLHYPLVTQVAERLIHFLEVIETPDDDVIEIITAFHTSIRAVVMGRVAGDGGKYGDELKEALNDACLRYFNKDRKKREESPDYDENF